MCFSIPLKVLAVSKTHATVEDGTKVRLSRGVSVKRGDYIRILGNMIVDKLTPHDALNVRRLIKQLNANML